MMSIEQFDSKLKNTEVLRIMRDCTNSRRTTTEQDYRNLLQDLCEHLTYFEAVQLLNRFVFSDTKELELREKDGGSLVSNKYSNMDRQTCQAILENQPAVAKIMKSCENCRLTSTRNGYMSALCALSMHVTMQESIEMLNYFGSITLLKDTDLDKLFRAMKSRKGFTDAFNFVLSHATQPNQKTVVIRGIPVILFHSWWQTLTPPDKEIEGDDDGEEEHEEDDIGDENSSKENSSTHLRSQHHVAPATVQLRFGNSNFRVMTFGTAEPHSRITSSKLFVGWDLEGYFCLVDPAARGCYGDQKLAFARLHGPDDVEVMFGDQPNDITLHYPEE
ncbi:hypothetical protein CB0940_12221 [Cercospora beticola]|uniref:Uncharacterized protein n=1 Tax=Cercospora beticola TaxID=122368 RepID=A0A2G5GKS7_CERBT|nr:hypothetical protein CB0940_12221 [Cercospora beticola]PIA80864.1 hypothetical protein CB0940_12221 [Cercospora beticola]WPB08518.1 hypothetical protein RHO25_013184 [Cercospora beticola]